MALSRARLHNPPTRPPPGPRTAEHVPQTLSALQSVRSAHILRLHALVEHLVSLAPSAQTSVRAVRAWRALCACREVHLSVLWQLGAAVLDRMRESADRGGGDEDDDGEEERWRANRRAEWLRFCQEGTVDRVAKFSEYCLALVAAGRADFALDELDSYLDNQPYHDSVALNTLYGLLALLLAQPASLPSSAPSRKFASDTSSDEDEGVQARQNGRSAKRVKLDNGARADLADDYGDLLRATADNSPNLFSKATERFRRAAHLEEREAREAGREPELGEAARWLALIRRHTDKSLSREGSPL
ncbi:hypothetical protein Rhopal_005593-T1 [Rhodotorula paludigena]|uniref:Proteophosphoglycan ppg4 n=1 Tax=Rhodotorula paludigena TaxID=86838 RepID=A0AAV5GQU7_9BASI|nr:hypothetical protein Rhopal_005593-T1 [Rhodotorula paludigena]